MTEQTARKYQITSVCRSMLLKFLNARLADFSSGSMIINTNAGGHFRVEYEEDLNYRMCYVRALDSDDYSPRYTKAFDVFVDFSLSAEEQRAVTSIEFMSQQIQNAVYEHVGAFFEDFDEDYFDYYHIA